jgi:SAM-dependent methyltransferase
MADERSAWDFIQPGDVSLWGENITDPEEQRRWCRTVLLAGSLPYMWRHKAAALRSFMYDALALKSGDRVLVIGERVDACGFTGDIRERVGPNGHVQVIDIAEEARNAYFARRRGLSGRVATWSWNYTRDVSAEAFDCVAVLQAVQHADDWREAGAELLRVLKPGRRLLLAEITFSPRLWMLAQSDIHLETWVEKLFSRAQMPVAEIPYYSPEELRQAFAGLLADPQIFVWKGIDLFWGTKPAAAAVP